MYSCHLLFKDLISIIYWFDLVSDSAIQLVAVYSVISLAIVSIIGKAVIEPLKYFSFNLPHRSNIETWILDISEGKTSLLGILANINDNWNEKEN